jgi:hypothetical protein
MLTLTAVFSLSLVLGALQQTIPSTSPAMPPEDVQIRINGPVQIDANDTASTVWVVNDNAVVNGVIREGLVVLNGTARVAGRIEGGILVVNGRLELEPGARVERDVMLYRSTMTRANDAVVLGAIHNQTGFSIGAGVVWLLWLSFTVVVVLAGIVYAELAPATLAESTTRLIDRSAQAAVVGLLVAAAVPTIATLSFATVIGIPLGLMLLFVVIPALTFVGYLISGAALGTALTSRRLAGQTRAERYGTVVVGLVVLQCAVALPIVGGLIGLAASLVGVGALASRAWTSRQHPAGVPAPAAAGA